MLSSSVDKASKLPVSGHTSWSTSGMAYLSFWLAGHLRCVDGTGHPARLVASLMPLAVSIWIGITRLQVSKPGLVL